METNKIKEIVIGGIGGYKNNLKIKKRMVLNLTTIISCLNQVK